jgi:hypothetical protein
MSSSTTGRDNSFCIAGSGKPISVFSVVMCFSIDASNTSLFKVESALRIFSAGAAGAASTTLVGATQTWGRFLASI